MGQIIINGDDFGISPETNRATIQAHEDGILTSASLMVNGPAFDEAVALARAHPRLSLGIHLVLIQGKAVLPPDQIPGLVDPDGNFRSNPTRAGLAYFFSPSLAAQIEKELQAQIEKFLATGLPLSHMNGHLHIHIHPTVFQTVLRLGVRYGIKALRLPQEELSISLRSERSRWASKLAHWMIFQSLSRHGRARLKNKGFRFPDCSYGLLQSGHMTERYVIALLDRIGDRRCEIAFHLGAAPDWPVDYDGRQELSTLLSPAVRERILHRGLKLIDYTDL